MIPIGAYVSAVTELQHPDAETAGAAFVTLMALMGDGGAGAGSSDGSSAAAAAAGAAAAEEEGAVALLLDAHYGLPAGARVVHMTGRLMTALPCCCLVCAPCSH